MDDKKTAEDIVAKAIIIALTREGPSVARTDTNTLRDDIATAIAAEREACAKVAEAEAAAFLSNEYATNQTTSSFCERFACKLVAAAIRDRGPET